jgi:hypothetical protein
MQGMIGGQHLYPTPFDMQPPLTNFRLILTFELTDDVPDHLIEHCLNQGLSLVHRRFPLTKSLVTYLEKGRLGILSLATVTPIELVKPVGPGVPTFRFLKERGASLSDLSNDYASGPRYPSGVGTHPIFGFKATRLQGGLVLCFLVHHWAVDGTGTSIIIHTFSEGCNQGFKDFQKTKVDVSESARTSFLDQLSKVREAQITGRKMLCNIEWKDSREADSISDPPSYRRKQDSHKSVTEPVKNPVCKIFKIPSDDLKDLKYAISTALQASPHTHSGRPEWVSTNDVVSALIMRCITRSRRLEVTQPTISAHITINARQKLDPPIPADYIGNCVTSCKVPLPYATLIQKDIVSLALIARSIRTGITEVNNNRVRHIASWIRAKEDADVIDFDWAYYGNTWDYGLVSWANMGQYDLDFGFGKPLHVRQPICAFSDSCRMLPRMRDGSQEIIIGLEAEDMERLRGDDVWRRWTVEVAT